MVSHITAVLVLAVLTVETGRTVRRFGERRVGVGGQFVSKPGPHLLMAVIYGAFGFGLYHLDWWPVYFSVGLVALAVAYAGFTLRWALREDAGG